MQIFHLTKKPLNVVKVYTPVNYTPTWSVSHAGCRLLLVAPPQVQIITYLSPCSHGCLSISSPTPSANWCSVKTATPWSPWGLIGSDLRSHYISGADLKAAVCRRPVLFIVLRNRYSCIQLLQPQPALALHSTEANDSFWYLSLAVCNEWLILKRILADI